MIDEKTISALKKLGRQFELSVIDPFLAADLEKVWYLLEGTINLSTTKVVKGEPYGRLDNFTGIEQGELIFGNQIDPSNNLCFLVDAEENSLLIELTLSDLKELAKDESYQSDLIELLETWIERLYEGVADDTSIPSMPVDEFLVEGTAYVTTSPQVIGSKKSLLWLESTDYSALRFNGHLTIPDYDGLFPLATNTYLFIDGTFKTNITTTQAILQEETVWNGIHLLNQLVFKSDEYEGDYRFEFETGRLIKKYSLQDEAFTDSLGLITKVFKSESSDGYDFDTPDEFVNACVLVARYDDIELEYPERFDERADKLAEISRYSNIRYREILLEGEWYIENTEDPFFTFIRDGKVPVAVLPDGKGKLICVVPRDRSSFEVGKNNMDLFEDEAYQFYKPFDRNKKISMKEIALFSFSRNKRDFMFVILTGFIGSLLGLVTPILSAQIFDFVIPNAERGQLFSIAFALFAVALGSMGFTLVKNFALLRVQGRMDYKLQSALWDRLLDLPSDFFKNFNTGDLASRSMGINKIREILSGTVIVSLLAGVFSIMNLVLLFYYSPGLALLAISISAIQVGMVVYFSRIQIKLQKVLLEEQGLLSGNVYQILNGIIQFRASGAESMAFLHWFKSFMKMKRISININKVQNQQTILSTAFGLLSMMFLYVTVITVANDLTTGEFLAFLAAYGAFVSAIVGMSASLMGALQVPVLYNRLKPILEEEPETSDLKEAPAALNGAIEINNVSFRYAEDAPLILDDLTISIKKGEYIALVGPSGSGKSTLIRLLLGFNEPETGSIFYDGQELDHLDPKLVRQQMGVVLQDGSLLAGDIYSNIIGSSTKLTLLDAFAAARAAAFDKDIRQMPMGMHTIVNEDGGTLSGGQRQRLMIARALVHKPKILIFDEATSALDNETQAIVTSSLDNLNVTRIVIAHRLSTIVNADKIYYLEGGKIQESGSYDELMELRGNFYKLAERQLE